MRDSPDDALADVLGTEGGGLAPEVGRGGGGGWGGSGRVQWNSPGDLAAGGLGTTN